MTSDRANPPATDQPNVVIAGTGVAALTAAVTLADEGVAVTLVAAGQDAAGENPGPDTLAATGSELMLGCCGHLVTLHRRLGLDTRIRWDRALHWIDPTGSAASLAGDDLPAPLHMLRGMLGLSLFTAGQRVTLLRGILALLQVSDSARDRLAGQTLAQWLLAHRQSPGLVDRFWSPLSRLACGAAADRVNADEAIRVLQEGLLHQASTYELGVSPVTHANLLAAARERIENAGGRFLTDGGLARIEVDGQRLVRLHQADGQEIPADQTILALSPPRLLEAGSDLGRTDARFARLASLEPKPRLDVHFPLATHPDEPALPGGHGIAMASPIALLLRQRVEPVAGNGDPQLEHVQAVIPDAGDWIDREPDRIAADARAELDRLLPRDGWQLRGEPRVVKRPEACFTAPLDLAGARPAVEGTIDNLYLAGSWADTGLPPTLESAAAAGTHAAHRVLARLGCEPPAVPGTQPSLLYRLLSG